ncbi:4-phosphoerythronate dehydrogenase [Thiomicrorhabdus sp. zzn3]|uniref:4-phosphoerythronate dehydrogenase n=1 Tax=Thiomicrorhabdus sp. zzn3 TaxID=3039775 RepID=UPI0024363F0B|nr:4-phosphoerythronate dehydrogenase [Thiomicrorhabdus sp. zzn3]MDG6779056.1 4-phosphoerythronate dehydrogenase [Thiomicrorhabdus sp. zzn3]
MKNRSTAHKKIVIDDAVPYAESMFSPLGEVVLIPGRNITPDSVRNADALIVRSRTQVNQALLENSAISFVGSTVVGLDHIDQAWLKQNNIHFYSAQGCNANSVAEFVITSLLELAEDKGFDLSQKTLGIIGVGHVGSLVHHKAEQLGIQCLLNDPPKVERHPEMADQYVSLDQALQADIITVHTPLTQTGKHPTHHLISAEKLQQIRPQQILVNAARGGIIDEQAWINTQTLANIIDCWENEPFINPQLYSLAYLATPHIAGHSLDAKVDGGRMVYEQLCRFWDEPITDNWQQQLPPPPEPITPPLNSSVQTRLFNTLIQTHNPRVDDRAIRDAEIENLYNKYESYRRNYPIYYEWKRHKFYKTGDKKFNNLLISLGFTPI